MSYFNTDPNAWYAISDSSGGFNTTLYGGGAGIEHAVYVAPANFSNIDAYWQIILVSGSHSIFTFRNRATGPQNCLDVNFNAAEVDPSHTQPALEPGDPPSTSQQWTIQGWGGDSNNFTSYQIQNVGNGTNFDLDDHPGNPLFLSSYTGKTPTQQWIFSSLGAINDASFSTNAALLYSATTAGATTTATTLATSNLTTADATITATTLATFTAAPTPTSTSLPSASPLQTSSSSSSKGVDIGVPVGVILGLALLLALFGFWWMASRKRRRSRQQARTNSLPPYSAPLTQMQPVEAPSEWKPAELDGVSRAAEMPDKR